MVHERIRRDWGYGSAERLSREDLIRQRYRGIRPAPGYPACPDHSEKRPLFRLLDAEAAAGLRLTETCAMVPAASVCGLCFQHPASRYFSVGPIGRDQVGDYAARKGMPRSEVETWLGPNLAYDPPGAAGPPPEGTGHDALPPSVLPSEGRGAALRGRTRATSSATRAGESPPTAARRSGRGRR